MDSLHSFPRIATVDTTYWKHQALLYWIYIAAQSKTGKGLPAGSKRIRAKQWEKMPAEIREGIKDADTQQTILDAVEKGMLWFCKQEDVGWHAGAKKGAKNVEQVQHTLEWIRAFESRSSVGGNKLLWCLVESKVEPHQ